jgi:hypothetical protein
MKKKITEIKTISKRARQELLNEYEKRLNAAQPIQYPSNIWFGSITTEPI